MAEPSPIAIVPDPSMGEMLHLCWMLHNVCNHRCSYCSELHWGGSHRWLKYENAVAFIDKILAHYGKKDTYHVSFSGGEPTLWPDFVRFCDYLKARGCEIGMTSNGTRPMRFWTQVRDHFNWLCLSYHPEFTRDDEFVRVVEFMANHAMLAIRLMMHPERTHWERSMVMAERLKGLGEAGVFYVEYVPLQKNFGVDSSPMEYQPWQSDFFASNSHFVVDLGKGSKLSPRKDLFHYHVLYEDGSSGRLNANNLVARGQVNFRGWSCHAGLDLVYVDSEGGVFRGACKQGGELGHVLDKDLAFPTEPISCAKTFCPCGTDIQVRKNSLTSAVSAELAGASTRVPAPQPSART